MLTDMVDVGIMFDLSVSEVVSLQKKTFKKNPTELQRTTNQTCHGLLATRRKAHSSLGVVAIRGSMR